MRRLHCAGMMRTECPIVCNLAQAIGNPDGIPFRQAFCSLVRRTAVASRAGTIQADHVEEVLSDIDAEDGALAQLVAIHNFSPPLPTSVMLSGDRADHPISSKPCS
ncbi:putative homologue of eukaryotic tubulin (plasmid) [Rhizobium johnstonii 3841]|uniref:Homologue of eukaryotic tubulin n=1 Tax=Rhizobium johnstonii (strain DSM 114642 / LMG 32736 / 3841) TaxID=216596 RepID=Q1M7X7_RHIJ3|nr:putative homologue of eukaryotic tubulin [Rhizobium johnstonii 3841]